jgi:hypothetical protein
VRKWVGTVAIVVCAALGSGVAAAATDQYRTAFKNFKVTLQAGGGGGKAKGKLESQKGKCVKKRKVKVFRKSGGDKHNLGSAKSDKEGKWKIELSSGEDGKYYAQVESKNLGANSSGVKQVCLSQKSAKLDFS